MEPVFEKQLGNFTKHLMIERLSIIKEYNQAQMTLLTRFRSVLEGMDKPDLTLGQKEYLSDQHREVTDLCIDANLIEEIVAIKNHLNEKEKKQVAW